MEEDKSIKEKEFINEDDYSRKKDWLRRMN